jgi:hypothetical protein
VGFLIDFGIKAKDQEGIFLDRHQYVLAFGGYLVIVTGLEEKEGPSGVQEATV